MTEFQKKMMCLDQAYLEISKRRGILEKKMKVRADYDRKCREVRSQQLKTDLKRLEDYRLRSSKRNKDFVEESDRILKDNMNLLFSDETARKLTETKKKFMSDLTVNYPKWKKDLLLREQERAKLAKKIELSILMDAPSDKMSQDDREPIMEFKSPLDDLSFQYSKPMEGYQPLGAIVTPLEEIALKKELDEINSLKKSTLKKEEKGDKLPNYMEEENKMKDRKGKNIMASRPIMEAHSDSEDKEEIPSGLEKINAEIKMLEEEEKKREHKWRLEEEERIKERADLKLLQERESAKREAKKKKEREEEEKKKREQDKIDREKARERRKEKEREDKEREDKKREEKIREKKKREGERELEREKERERELERELEREREKKREKDEEAKKKKKAEEEARERKMKLEREENKRREEEKSKKEEEEKQRKEKEQREKKPPINTNLNKDQKTPTKLKPVEKEKAKNSQHRDTDSETDFLKFIEQKSSDFEATDPKKPKHDSDEFEDDSDSDSRDDDDDDYNFDSDEFAVQISDQNPITQVPVTTFKSLDEVPPTLKYDICKLVIKHIHHQIENSTSINYIYTNYKQDVEDKIKMDEFNYCQGVGEVRKNAPEMALTALIFDILKSTKDPKIQEVFFKAYDPSQSESDVLVYLSKGCQEFYKLIRDHLLHCVDKNRTDPNIAANKLASGLLNKKMQIQNPNNLTILVRVFEDYFSRGEKGTTIGITDKIPALIQRNKHTSKPLPIERVEGKLAEDSEFVDPGTDTHLF